MSACTCVSTHVHKGSRGNGRLGYCTHGDCRCVFAPPVRRMAVPRPRAAGVGKLDANLTVLEFERELMDQAPPVQTLTIRDWHPATSPNARGDWRVIHKRHKADQTMAWAAAQHAGWRYVRGKVSLSITLVYPRTYRVDADNLAAKCKGLIDGLKLHNGQGFFRDDSTEWLELHVTSEVRKGVKATEIALRPALEARGATHQLALTGGIAADAS